MHESGIGEQCFSFGWTPISARMGWHPNFTVDPTKNKIQSLAISYMINTVTAWIHIKHVNHNSTTI